MSTASVPDAVHKVAGILAQVEQTGVPCAPVRGRLAKDDISAANAVQRVTVQRRVAAQGRRVVDRKIGLTSPAVQRQLGDNASSGLFVLGGAPVPLTSVDLRSVGMTLTRNGERVSEGSGSNCLGGPLNAAVRLASTLAAMGDPLRAGDVVLTGALGPMVPAAPDDAFETHISGLGSVRVGFAPHASAIPDQGDTQ
ncbi:fumarylacetoacetate hydrolase family protein [Streptomyces sp. NPDC002143]